MRRPVIAIVLWIFAASVQAQCDAQSAATDDAAKTGAATVGARPEAGLIKIAGAQTHVQALGMDDGLPVVSEKTPATSKTGDEQQRGDGPAMLLATLAVMSGIALRRYIARMK